MPQVVFKCRIKMKSQRVFQLFRCVTQCEIKWETASRHIRWWDTCRSPNTVTDETQPNTVTGRYESSRTWLIVPRHWFTVRGPLQPLASVHRVVLVDGRPQRAGQRHISFYSVVQNKPPFICQQVVFKCRMKMKSHRVFHLFRCVKKVCK